MWLETISYIHSKQSFIHGSHTVISIEKTFPQYFRVCMSSILPKKILKRTIIHSFNTSKFIGNIEDMLLYTASNGSVVNRKVWTCHRIMCGTEFVE